MDVCVFIYLCVCMYVYICGCKCCVQICMYTAAPYNVHHYYMNSDITQSDNGSKMHSSVNKKLVIKRPCYKAVIVTTLKDCIITIACVCTQDSRHHMTDIYSRKECKLIYEQGYFYFWQSTSGSASAVETPRTA